MSKDLEKALNRINEIVDKEITEGKREESDRERRIEFTVKGFEETYPGLTEFYQDSKKPKKSKKKNSKPKAKAESLPSMDSDNTLPDEARQAFEQLVETHESLTFDELEQKFWRFYEDNEFDDQTDRNFTTLMDVQADVSSILRPRDANSFTFIPTDIEYHYLQPSTKKVDADGQDHLPPEERRQNVNKVMNDRGSVYGLFTKNDETQEEGFGSVMCWTKEAAISLENLEPYKKYIGEFEGQMSDGVFVLSLNETGKFEDKGPVNQKEIDLKLKDYIMNTDTSKIIDMGEVENKSYVLSPAGENIIIKGQVQKIQAHKIFDKKTVGSILISSSIPGVLGNRFVNFSNNPNSTNKYQERSIVLIGAYCKIDTKGNEKFYGKWVLPIIARGAVKTVAPEVS